MNEKSFGLLHNFLFNKQESFNGIFVNYCKNKENNNSNEWNEVNAEVMTIAAKLNQIYSKELEEKATNSEEAVEFVLKETIKAIHMSGMYMFISFDYYIEKGNENVSKFLEGKEAFDIMNIKYHNEAASKIRFVIGGDYISSYLEPKKDMINRLIGKYKEGEDLSKNEILFLEGVSKLEELCAEEYAEKEDIEENDIENVKELLEKSKEHIKIAKQYYIKIGDKESAEKIESYFMEEEDRNALINKAEYNLLKKMIEENAPELKGKIKLDNEKNEA